MSAEIRFTGKEREKPSPENTVTLFVSLYVVLLAFFILLASNAQFDADRTRDVLKSVNATFSSSSSSDSLAPPSIGGGRGIAQFFGEMQQSVQSVVPLEEMQVLTDGRQMIVTLPDTALFNRDDPHLRHDRRQFYDRLTDTLLAWREDMRIRLTMQQGVAATAPSTLEITRAGNFARFMENRGVEPRNLGIAIEQGNPGTITLTFEVLPPESEGLNLPEERNGSAPIPLGGVR